MYEVVAGEQALGDDVRSCSYTRTCPASGAPSSFVMAPTATRDVLPASDTECPKESASASPTSGAPTCPQVDDAEVDDADVKPITARMSVPATGSTRCRARRRCAFGDGILEGVQLWSSRSSELLLVACLHIP